MHDDSRLDDVAVLALGALPESEARSLAQHIGSCAICRAEYVSLRSTANLLGYATECAPIEPNEIAAQRLKSRVMRAVRSDLAESTRTIGATDAVARPRTPWIVYGGAVAAALVAVVSLVDDASQRSIADRTAVRVMALEHDVATHNALAKGAVARTRELDARLAQMVAPGSKHFAVAGGEVIASSGRVIIALRNLPTLPKGRVYQAWTLANGAKSVAPSSTFSADPRGVTFVELPERAGNLAAVAVSVEPEGGSKAPTSKPNFVRPLS